MIIANGTIQFKHKQGGGIDPLSGYPQAPAKVEWGEPIPCQWQQLGGNNLQLTNGERTSSASYSVLIEEMPMPSSQQVRLTDSLGQDLGEFSFKAPAEPLNAVCQIKILL